MFPTSEHPLSTCPMPAPALVAGAENSHRSRGGSSTEVPPQRDTSSLGTAAVQAPTPPRAGSRKTIATWKDGYEITDSSCCSGGCHISHHTSLLFTGTLAGLNGLRTG